MAFICLPRILVNDFVKSCAVLSYAPKLIKIQSANICSKENRDPDIIKPDPWPYKEKRFGMWRAFLDGTVKRFDENTKIIVVDGNIGAGKSSFAKELAEAFDMVYFPEPTMERYFISAYGYDIRKIDALLPPSYKCCDINTFYTNPYHQNVTKFQYRMYMFRLEQYLRALAHVLNTGQGVVLERSVYGDFVFMETMLKFGYVSQPAMKLYKDINNNTLDELMRPHLIIYLDISSEVALERIKKRNIPAEVNSKVLTKEYLETIEHFYKQHYLKNMEEHAEVLVYDWSNYGDIEVVVEDIERIDFERFTKYDLKMKDWRRKDDWEWTELRLRYTKDIPGIMYYGCIYRPSVTEVFHPREETYEMEELLHKIPGEKYAVGFNPLAGDKWLFRMHPDSYFGTHVYRLP